jgi:hypothetical protein
MYPKTAAILTWLAASYMLLVFVACTWWLALVPTENLIRAVLKTSVGATLGADVSALMPKHKLFSR